MASGEKYTKETLSDVSWRDCLSQDPYYGLSNSFQYSENINCDDELHGIKLSQKAESSSSCSNCQLVMAGENIFAIPLSGGTVKYFTADTWTSPSSTSLTLPAASGTKYKCIYGDGVVFQDYVWGGVGIQTSSVSGSGVYKINVTGSGTATVYTPYDHTEATDESISDESTKTATIASSITAICNYNNTRLVIGAGQELRVYYPELDMANPDSPIHDQTATAGYTGWKKVQQFENGCTIVGLTCTFEYLKVRVTNEGWDTKIYYYQGNDDLRNTFVYNTIDLTSTKVLRVYNINGIDYYTASLDGTDGYITFNKIIGATPVQLFKQRGGLSSYDANQKSTYFVGPTSHNAAYLDGAFYVADSYGVFKFLYEPQGYDKGYLKWKINSSTTETPGLAITENYVFTSDENGLHRMRLYDTGVDGYQSKGILVSREMEGKYGGCVAKMLDEVRLHFELNPLISSSSDAGDIDIYVSPNNMWREVDPTSDSTGRYKVMHIDGSSGSQNRNTRFEITTALNNLNGTPAFEFDWETITYCVVITRGSSSAQRTPIVREVQMTYHLKGKTNNIYDIS